MKKDVKSDVKRLAEFIGYPFSIEKIIKLCSFENQSKLEVNKSGNICGDYSAIENRFFYRKAKDGDWEN